MQKTVEAIFEHGVLKPTQPIDWIEENRHVTVTINVAERSSPLEGWVGGISDEDAREMIQAIQSEFEGVNPDDWK